MADESIIVDNFEEEYEVIDVLDIESSATQNETIQIIEVGDTEIFTVDTNNAFSALGEPNEQLRHQLLTGRDANDQHPISAITGLREELDNIQALQTIYSDKKQVADYYLWDDENLLQEKRVGYFVSVCEDIRKISICNGENIFGVTIDSAAFVGGQDDIARDIKYGLVVHSGIAHVRCELDVNIGDFVVSNGYGMATKSDSNYGYKVVALHDIDGILHAAVSLCISVDQIDLLGDEVGNLVSRMGEVDKDIVAAMNVAQQAYNKADEVGEVSEEAIKSALEAMEKANDVSEKTDGFEERLENTNALAVQAQALALSASNSALDIKDEAVKIANDALTNVNNVIEDFEPIYEWEDPETGNTGAEYLTTYIQNGLATKAEVQTVETKTDENKSAILQNGQEIQTLVSSVDKYSVGEYSQAYGLTYEQAKSILKIGMIYIPVDNPNGKTHIEEYEGQGQENEFTEHNYYKWTGDDWQEYSNSVAFFSEEPSPSKALQYWYIDANVAPEGYEPYALYINKDGQWVKVNILDGNVNNRITSMIRQTADKIAFDVVNAQDSIASHQQWIDNNSANVQDIASMKSDIKTNTDNIATTKLTADATGASVAQVVAEIGKYATVDGAWSETDKVIDEVYYTTDDQKYWYYKDGVWNGTDNPIEAGLEVNAASIVTAINNGDSSVVINADHVDISGIDISLKGQTINLTADDITIQSDGFSVDSDGYMIAASGKIGGWTISNADTNSPALLYNKSIGTNYQIGTGMACKNDDSSIAFYAGYTGSGDHPWDSLDTENPFDLTKFYVTNNGYLYSNSGRIGGINIADGSIWSTSDGDPSTDAVHTETTTETKTLYGGDATFFQANINWVNGVVSGYGVSTAWYNYAYKVPYGCTLKVTTSASQVEVGALATLPIGNSTHTVISGTVNTTTQSEYTVVIPDGVGDCYFIVNQVGSSDNSVTYTKTTTTTTRRTVFSVTKDGWLTTSGGTIAGWNITPSFIDTKVANSNKRFYLASALDSAGEWICATDEYGNTTFKVDKNGYLYANGATIYGGIYASYGEFTGTIYASGGTFGGATFGTDSDNATFIQKEVIKINSTSGAALMLGMNGNIRLGNSDAQILLNYQGGKHLGTWDFNVSPLTGSDKNLKNSIEPLSTNYSILFDNLNPVRFKYNDGTSNRYHTGFIAQELQQAIVDADLTEQEVAAICTFAATEDDPECMGIRYEELIALCVNEIQKLKTRVKELENKEN